jgi:7,8-dihydropterin-6-yl-methyl-4-(beta-D-ribofuranosyl)aminobenzene 5'-phosphate synthase
MRFCKTMVIVLGMMFILAGTGTKRLAAKPDSDITVTILYDNYVYMEGTKADWGFSCLIKGTEKTILFDTGTRPNILFHNIKKLNVNPNDVELVVISHIHDDHTGGLWAFLEKNPNVKVFLPHSFPDAFVRKVEKYKAEVVSINQPMKVCENVFLTGELGNKIKEQSLILDTDKGLIVITGCSHPGIVKIVKKAMEIRKKKVFMVFGGFHLMRKSENELKEIITQFKELGVLKVGATHCTGDTAIKRFKDAYGKNYVDMGVGRVLKF